MNSRQRVLGALERRGYDRIPVKHEGTPEVNRMPVIPGVEAILHDGVAAVHGGECSVSMSREAVESWRI